MDRSSNCSDDATAAVLPNLPDSTEAGSAAEFEVQVDRRLVFVGTVEHASTTLGHDRRKFWFAFDRSPPVRPVVDTWLTRPLDSPTGNRQVQAIDGGRIGNHVVRVEQ